MNLTEHSSQLWGEEECHSKGTDGFARGVTCCVPVRATPAEPVQRPADSVIRWTGAPGDLRLTDTQLTVSPTFMAFEP